MTSSNGNIFRVTGLLCGEFNSPYTGQWRGVLMFSLICTWINDWENNREADDFRRYRTHYDVIVMWLKNVTTRTKNQEQSDTNFAADSRARGCHNDNLPCIKLWEASWELVVFNDKIQHRTYNYMKPLWAQSQYKEDLSRYGDFHYKDKTVAIPSYHNGNPMLVRRHLYIETVLRI